MTNEPVREDATDIRPAGAGARCQAAPQSTTPRARQVCHGTEPMFSLDRCGRVGAIGGAAPAPLRVRLDVPVLGVTRPAGLRRDALPRRLRLGRSLVDAGSGGLAGLAPAARRGRGALPGPAVGDKRRATLRRGVASLTETVGRASFEQRGRRAGEGAR
ncbi:DUF6380 family protein [Streptomyces afghaniensis]|uniref:DUF6380 family protein n=1 Tax=Streptomyces afghaniensis TaxID=66865 RepID=UPI00277EEFBD|nr:DUF6380 family protein [Streptomyces afghaniensis]MDQ1014740.1 hypothetical protein [Streptomyces afghaniensis]